MEVDIEDPSIQYSSQETYFHFVKNEIKPKRILFTP